MQTQRPIPHNLLSPMRFYRFVHKSGSLSVVILALFVLASAGFMARDVESSVDRPVENDDHAAILRGLDAETLEAGRDIYVRACAACHGVEGGALLPSARSFDTDTLRYGNDPYAMWQTVTYGKGQMTAQSWLTPEERYYVIQYIREELVKPKNAGQYFEVTEEYLAGLPTGEEVGQDVVEAAAEGLQAAGMTWAGQHPGDYGNVMYSQLADKTSDALTIALDEEIYLSYNVLRMRLAAAWRGGLDLSETKFAQYRGEGKPVISGQQMEGLAVWRWEYPGEYAAIDAETSPRAPLPAEAMTYHGHYRHDKEVVLSYSIMGRDVLEWPSAEHEGDDLVLVHTLRIGPSEQGHRLVVGHEVMAEVTGDVEGMTSSEEGGEVFLHIPTSDVVRTVQIRRRAGAQGRGAIEEMSAGDTPDLVVMTRGGPSQWPETIVTGVERGVPRAHYDPMYYEDEDRDTPEKLVDLPEDYPYTVDKIGLPFVNLWNSWIRPTALAFYPDGRMVLTTYLGDVWVADGLDDTLAEVTWRRIATGLYEPMGVEVVDGVIYVAARDRIVRLHDLNGDMETDYYETFYADKDVSDFFHSFAFGLQADAEGNLYYAKSGQYTNNATPGDLVRVTPDGTGGTIATGFRTPNGLTVAPDGRVFVTDNQGNWTPANEINLVEPGKFYGYVNNIAERGWSPDGLDVEIPEGEWSTVIDTAAVPDSFTEPVIWLPQEFDNSPGGGIWTDASWGPLGDRMLNTSFGKGWAYYLMFHEVDGVTQAAAAALPFQFDAGTQRVRVNPADGQIYLTGLTGWDDGFATRYAHLDRIRYTGGEGQYVTETHVKSDGIEFTFNFPVDAAAASDTSRYDVTRWDYKWQRRYGSYDWSVENPEQQGRDTVPVEAVQVDGRRVRLVLPDMQPADQVLVRMQVPSAEGGILKEAVYLTVHKVPGG